MRELSILFTKENRLASIRDVNPKTQTRRVIKLPETIGEGYGSASWSLAKKPQSYGVNDFAFIDMAHPTDSYPWLMKAPYQVGDILGMPEPYQVIGSVAMEFCIEGVYLDDMSYFDVNLTEREWKLWVNRKKPYMKTQARFMYDSLIRHFVKVKRVRVERLQSISAEDCLAEGIWKGDERVSKVTIIQRFRTLWNSNNKKRGYGWDKNPWDWVYDYERINK